MLSDVSYTQVDLLVRAKQENERTTTIQKKNVWLEGDRNSAKNDNHTLTHFYVFVVVIGGGGVAAAFVAFVLKEQNND